MAVDNEESIYEEIITPSFAEQKRSCRNLSAFSRSISMDARINGHRPTQKILVESLNENLESNKKEIAQEEELYAVILGDEVECRNIDDLLNNDIKMDNKNEMHSSTLPSEKLVDIAQTDNSGASKDPDRNNQRKSSNNRPKLTRRPASFPKLLYERTEYAEILHTKPATEVSFNPCRPTRESDNPILRQEVIPSNNPSPVSASPAGSLRRTRNGDSTRSTSGDSGIQEDFHPTRVYENTNETRTTCNNRWSSTARDHCINRSSSEPEINVNFYENTHSSQNIEPQYENSFVDDTKRRHSDPASPMNSRKFIYQNIDNNGNEITPSLRSRTSSKPIDIKPISKTDKPRVLESPSNGLELTYSDLSFNETSIESFSSSPECGSSVSSDVSSNVSTIVSESVSPPPLPKARPSSLYMPRPRMSSFTSIYSTYSPLGPNHLKGLYVGCHNVHKTNPESIDRAVKEVALKANMLGLKTVSFEIINGLIKLGTVSPPLQLVSSFSLTDIHNVDRYSKDLRFLGFVVSKPGKEAVCHVIQSDQSEEILDAVKDAFKATSVVSLIFKHPHLVSR